eukprot:365923-Chlamydomonas_euryale.AAC.4
MLPVEITVLFGHWRCGQPELDRLTLGIQALCAIVPEEWQRQARNQLPGEQQQQPLLPTQAAHPLKWTLQWRRTPHGIWP